MLMDIGNVDYIRDIGQAPQIYVNQEPCKNGLCFKDLNWSSSLSIVESLPQLSFVCAACLTGC